MLLPHLNFIVISTITCSACLLGISGSLSSWIGYCRCVVKFWVLNRWSLATGIGKLARWKHLMLTWCTNSLKCIKIMLNLLIPPLVVLKISSCFLPLRWWLILWNRLQVRSLIDCSISTDRSGWKIKEPFWICIHRWPLVWLVSILLLHTWVLLSVVWPVANISGFSGASTIKIFHQRLLGY